MRQVCTSTQPMHGGHRFDTIVRYRGERLALLVPSVQAIIPRIINTMDTATFGLHLLPIIHPFGLLKSSPCLLLLPAPSSSPLYTSLKAYNHRHHVKVTREIALSGNELLLCNSKFHIPSTHRKVINNQLFQAFAMYGYDAGVLGGVQGTEPFLSAMGVLIPPSSHLTSYHHKSVRLRPSFLAPHRHLCYPHDSICVHPCCSVLFSDGHHGRHAPRSPKVHPTR
jgi:hypothetical protein